MYTIDFETEAIVAGADKSPKPVGLAVKHNGKRARYISWGHLNLDGTLQKANQHSFEQAHIELSNIWDYKDDILCHNAKFDIRICMDWFGLPYPEASRVHDTLFLAFLNDPREKVLKLKELADKYLDMPPQEQDELKEWIMTNVPNAKLSDWGAHICYAPVKMVKKYAIGDVDRTYKLYKYFTKEMKK